MEMFKNMGEKKLEFGKHILEIWKSKFPKI